MGSQSFTDRPQLVEISSRTTTTMEIQDAQSKLRTASVADDHKSFQEDSSSIMSSASLLPFLESVTASISKKDSRNNANHSNKYRSRRCRSFAFPFASATKPSSSNTVSTAGETDNAPISILLIGAMGTTALECLKHLSGNPVTLVYLLAPDLRHLPSCFVPCCEEAIEGSAEKVADLERALRISQPDVVIFLDNHKDEATIRAAWTPVLLPWENQKSEESLELKTPRDPLSEAKALIRALSSNGECHDTRVVVVEAEERNQQCCRRQPRRASSPTKKRRWMRRGPAVPVVVDEPQEQEEKRRPLEDVFAKDLELVDRVTFVRPTLVRKPMRRRSLFSAAPAGDESKKTKMEKSQSSRRLVVANENGSAVECESLTEWVVQESFAGTKQGCTVHVTCARM